MFNKYQKECARIPYKDTAKVCSQRGTSLIEVIVSLLILGVGLLGMLSLQANGLNGNQRANFVTDAQILAQDMADRIRASANTASSSVTADLVRTGSYNNINISKGGTPVAACDPTATACNSAGAVAYNQNEWLVLLNNSSLPRGQAAVSWNLPVYTIQVMWDQERDGLAVNCGISNCFQMEVRVP